MAARLHASTFVLLGLLLPVWWGLNLGVVVLTIPDNELYPMSSYPMFSMGRQTQADDYRWFIQADNASAPVEVNGVYMFDEYERIEPATGRRIYIQMLRSIEHGCSGAQQERPCTKDPQDWRAPDGYGELWTRVGRARAGFSDDPYSLTLVLAEVPVDSGVVGILVERPILTYYPATDRTEILVADPA